ncbi:MAG: hypothetical protein C4321_10550, partial [Chloroflexota bacterium]
MARLSSITKRILTPLRWRKQAPLGVLFSQWAGGIRGFLAGSKRNWAHEAGLLYDNAVVFAVVSWYIRQIGYPRLIVRNRATHEEIASDFPRILERGP